VIFKIITIRLISKGEATAIEEGNREYRIATQEGEYEEKQ